MTRDEFSLHLRYISAQIGTKCCNFSGFSFCQEQCREWNACSTVKQLRLGFISNPIGEIILNRLIRYNHRRSDTEVRRNLGTVILSVFAVRYRQILNSLFGFIRIFPQNTLRSFVPQHLSLSTEHVVDPTYRCLWIRVRLGDRKGTRRESFVPGDRRLLYHIALHRTEHWILCARFAAERHVSMPVREQQNLIVFDFGLLLVIGLREGLMVEQILAPQLV
ncbi:hypothetical protein D3C77_484390 [compost metagenome]